MDTRLWKHIKDKMQRFLWQKITEDGATMTFEEMIIFVEKFSQKLKRIKCCAILCESEMATSMALLSCFAAQVTALPLSLRYGNLHCKKILDAISPDAVITDQDGEFQIFYIKDSTYVSPEVHPALIMCTSGTTGVPKGVMLTEANIITNLADIAVYFDINTTDKILISRPLYHCAVLTGEFLVALTKGVETVFYSGIFNPPYVLKLIKEYKITTFCGTPTILRMMTGFKRNQEEVFLKNICISGECMGEKVAKQISNAFPDAKIYHIYGLTEACPRVSYLPPDMFEKYADCVGVPLRSVQLRVISSAGEPVGVNETGTLWVKGDNVMIGYYNDPEKTNEVIKDGWLCTGDLALINEAGLLKIKGRIDDLIIKAGMNIYPQEIEGVLKLDSRVREAVVCGCNDEKLGTQIVLNIVGDFRDVAEVKELCHSQLPAFQVPTRINLVDDIPKNGSGKIIRR